MLHLAARALLILAGLAATATAQTLRPDEVVVIANKASPDSLAVAKHYMEKRGIPQKHLFLVDFPKSPRTISFEHFETKVAAPLRAWLDETQLRDAILCLVTVHDVPYVVSGPKISEEERAEIAKNGNVPNPNMVLTTRASLDSELAWLYRGDVKGLDREDLAFRRVYCYQNRNPYYGQPMSFREFRRRAAEPLEKLGLLYMTARLEGPTPEIARGLVDKAMAAEREGPSGIGYFDSKGATLGNRKAGYPEGEFWARRAWIETHNAGFKTVREQTGELFGEGACPDALIYWGWYKLRDYQPSFGKAFRPGAIAVHTASAEATDIRKATEKGGPWCAGFLTHGVTATVGPVGEPFLSAFPHAEIFFPRLYQGWSLGDVYWNSHVELSWMMVLIGDPLYTPFAGPNRRPHYVRTAIAFADNKAVSGGTTPLALVLKAEEPIFKDLEAYKVVDPGVNGPKLKLGGLDSIKAELREGGTLLVLTGPTLEAADLGEFKPRDERGPELEIHVDLGPDGGLKILSQLLAW